MFNQLISKLKSTRSGYQVLFFILLSQLAGLVGSLFTFPAISSWYAFLNKPTFSPPNWLFSPVWLTLYTLMGIAAYLVFKEGYSQKRFKLALQIFLLQLVLNSLWSILFFGLQNPFLAFLEIISLWLMIIVTIRHFLMINRQAAYLLVPYLLWVSFAAILNLAIWKLNI